jgi:SNF2 family DNA or RNA helicase
MQANLDQLRQMGVDVHPHILRTNYDWCGGTPFEIQKITVELLTENQRAYVLNSMGTGKTKAVLWGFDYLRRCDVAHRMLVVAPLSTLRFTWTREVLFTTPHLKCAVLHGTREKRFKLLAEDADIYIVNHDGLKIIADEVAKRKDINVLCIDELATYRNRTKRSRVAENLAQRKEIVWGLTGAPMPNAPTDVWQQARIITPTSVPRWWSTFRDQTMLRINQFKFVPRRGSVEMALNAVKPNVRFTLDDIMELPPFITRRVDVAMGPKQQEVYKAVAKDCFMFLKEGQISAANAGAVMSKLLQISLGWVYDDKHETIHLDNHERNAALVDLIEAAEHKVLIFVPFIHALQGIKRVLDAAEIECATVSGATPLKERDVIFREFQLGRNDGRPQLKALVAHPQCMSHGNTFTEASTVIWYGPITSTEIYDQANARVRRVGQTRKQLFLHLQATATEKHIYGLLTHHIKVQDSLLQLLEDDSRAMVKEAA